MVTRKHFYLIIKNCFFTWYIFIDMRIEWFKVIANKLCKNIALTLLNSNVKTGLKLWGLWLEGQGQWARLCCRLNIWLHILVILFYPHVVWSVKCLAHESPKKNYTKEKTETDKRRIRFFYTFLYLMTSTIIPWMREFFLNTLKWLSSGVKKYVNSFHVCSCRHLVFRASIRVIFLLEVLSKSGKG